MILCSETTLLNAYGGGGDIRKKAFRSELKLVMSPSAVTNENTSQFPFGPCFRFQVCPPTWMFEATVFPMPPTLSNYIISI